MALLILLFMAACAFGADDVALDICHMPFEIGTCDSFDGRYGYDPKIGKCKEYIYSGCGGNANNFLTEEECEKATRACRERDVRRSEGFQESNLALTVWGRTSSLCIWLAILQLLGLFLQ
nr:unnamed protein product [Spirometra erinaceieuropaei]